MANVLKSEKSDYFPHERHLCINIKFSIEIQETRSTTLIVYNF